MGIVLPLELCELAWRNALEKSKHRYWADPKNTTLVHLFNWSQSEMGHSFWLNIDSARTTEDILSICNSEPARAKLNKLIKKEFTAPAINFPEENIFVSL